MATAKVLHPSPNQSLFRPRLRVFAEVAYRGIIPTNIMAMRNLTVTFHTNVYSKNWKGFQFPSPLARLLGRKKGKKLTLALTKYKA